MIALCGWMILMLALAAYWAGVGCFYGFQSQEDLNIHFAPKSEADTTASSLYNVYFLTHDLSLFVQRFLWLLLCPVVVYLLFRLEFGLYEWIMVAAASGLAVCVFFVLGLCWAKRCMDRGMTVMGGTRKLLQSLFCLLSPLVAPYVRSFHIESYASNLETKKTKVYKRETLLKGILQFRNENVKDIMTARLDIVDLDISTPFPEVLRLISENSYSRVPVYSGTKDNIVGVLYIKDVLPYLGKTDKFRWSSLIRPQFSVPETKKIDNLLREFQSRKIHMAVVIDEYGGVAGVVTLEDVIEEIVGEINDEYDDDHKPYVAIGVDEYVFDAKTSLQDFCKLFNLDSSFFDQVDGDADTVAGLLLDLIGDLPQKHQEVHFQQFKFEILEVDERHIAKVKVSVEASSEDNKSDESDLS